jgi:hypothetical protein
MSRFGDLKPLTQGRAKDATWPISDIAEQNTRHCQLHRSAEGCSVAPSGVNVTSTMSS